MESNMDSLSFATPTATKPAFEHYLNMAGLAYFATIVGFLICYRLLRSGRRESYLPPGPPTRPIVGNLHIFPQSFPHLTFTQWARKYGGIYSVTPNIYDLFVYSNAQVLDKRGASSASRPTFHAVDIITDGLYFAFRNYDSPIWKVGRKSLQTLLTPQALDQLLPLQKKEVLCLAHDLLTTPEKFYEHILRATISVITFTLFGRHCPTHDDEIVQSFHTYIKAWSSLLQPGAIPPIDQIPLLKFIPERWAPWKTECRRIRGLQRNLYHKLLETCERRLQSKEGPTCYLERVMKNSEELGFKTRDMLAYHAGVILDGGSDSSASFIKSLILALIAFPEVQSKAWSEIDHLVGDNRMPDIDDLPRLPYVQAILKETHRFRPVVPCVPPHVTTADEKYGEYIIPKGSTIIMNNWAIFHDPAFFDKPEDFMPERFLSSEFGTKPSVEPIAFRANLAFGAGRRICPGYHLANNMLGLTAMTLLWAFEFSEGRDSGGEKIPVDLHNYAQGLTTAPLPYKCTITPRNESRQRVIENEFKASFY